MNDLTSKNSSSLLAAGGAGFLALAAIFLVRDLALPPETLLGAGALLASVAAILGRPRRWPWVAPGALLAVAIVGGGWYLAVTSPALLPGLALAAFGAIAAVVLHERRASGAPSDAAARSPGTRRARRFSSRALRCTFTSSRWASRTNRWRGG